MKKVSEYLTLFRKLTPPHRAIKRSTTQIIKQQLGITLSEHDVGVRAGIVYVSAPSVLKSEISLNKERLVTLINKNLGSSEFAVKDIR